MRELPPLALYVHLPWCVRKCPYCDFNSVPLAGSLRESDYVRALLADLAFELNYGNARPLMSIFIGGGTPSLFSASAIDDLLAGIRKLASVASGAEITLEANPGTADAGSFAGYRAAGINRLSLGVQSFRDAQLRRIGRIHDAATATAAFAIARSAGFENLNIDLMFGLPGDSRAGAITDLEAALALRPEHVSWYQLTIEAHTAFAHRPPRLPAAATIGAIQEAGETLLAAHGYQQYEISAYAQPGRQAAHNLNYWRFGDYLGIGAGAHGKITGSDGTIMRTAKRAQPEAYLRHAGTAAAGSRAAIRAPEEMSLEFMMNALRLRDGFDLQIFAQRTGLPVVALQPRLAEACARGLLSITGDAVRATPRGWRFLNDLLLLFVPDGPPRPVPARIPS